MTIRKRLMSGFIASAFLVGMVGIIALVNCEKINREISLVKQGQAINEDIIEIRQQEKNYLLFHENVYLEKIEEKLSQLKEHIAKRKKEIKDRKILDALDEINNNLKAYEVLFDEVVKDNKKKEEAVLRIRLSARAVEKGAKGKKKEKEIIAALLEARRQEKNYQAYQDKKLIFGEKAYQEKFKDAIKWIRAATGDDKEVNLLIDRYAADFESLVKSYKKADESIDQTRVQARITERLIVEIAKSVWLSIENVQKNAKMVVLIIFIIAVILAIGLGLGISRSVNESIGRLVTATQRISSGDLTTEVKVKNSDEMSRLASSFNVMVQNLKKSKRNIEEYGKTLEKGVEERTKELQAANILLKKANQMKSEFCASMSHELRTPLNSIIGFSGIILKGMSGDINEEQRKQLNMVYGGAKHLLGLINNILDLSKIEAGKMEVVPESFEINELIDTVEKLVLPMVEDKGLKLITKLPENLCHVYSDKHKVKQILINLLSNAAKFTDKGEIKVECCQKEDFLQISVSDTGRGIKEEDIKFIFDEFKQISDIGENKPGGTGLGLAISKKMVEILGGKIWAKSEYGKGSKFTFSLPLRVAPEIKREPIPGKRRDITKKLILTIDDQKETQEMLKIYLVSEGYEVIPAYTGIEAIRLAKELNPFAITLDIIMPDIDGWGILRELKRTPETKNIPVIVVSIVDNRNLGLSLGSVGYLVKPIEKDDLIRSLRHLEKKNNIKVKDIFIIDDNFKDVEDISAILSSEETGYYQVRKAYSGKEGLELIKKKKPDLILLDLMMPETNGFEIIRELKKDNETKGIPIIIITAKDLTKDEADFLRNNIQKIVLKRQFTKKELLEDIKKTLERFETKEKLS